MGFRINRAMHDWHQLLTLPDSGSPAGCALALAIWVPLTALVVRCDLVTASASHPRRTGSQRAVVDLVWDRS